jgi:hypothetical protein
MDGCSRNEARQARLRRSNQWGFSKHRAEQQSSAACLARSVLIGPTWKVFPEVPTPAPRVGCRRRWAARRLVVNAPGQTSVSNGPRESERGRFASAKVCRASASRRPSAGCRAAPHTADHDRGKLYDATEKLLPGATGDFGCVAAAVAHRSYNAAVTPTAPCNCASGCRAS